MLRRPPSTTRTDTLFPYRTLFRAAVQLRVSDASASGTQAVNITVTNSREGIAVERVGTGFDQPLYVAPIPGDSRVYRSEEHTSELQSLMRISYAVFCLNKKTTTLSSIEKQMMIPSKKTLQET